MLIRTDEEAKAALHALRTATIDSFQRLWIGGRTAEMLEGFGAKAETGFAQHEATVQFILESAVRLNAPELQIAPEDYTPPVDMPYTVHDDGTITLD